MKIVTSWIREFVEIPATDRELAERLTLAGLAIDAVETAANGESVLEADIGTNRPDAMNHYGLAREASTLYDRDLKPIRPAFSESSKLASDVASVEILDPDLCPRYSARVIMGVKVGPSPDWMVRRLEAAGQRSINNVADVTNYLMLENGQPLHSFDLDKVAGRKIIVRRARVGETMETLDGVERKFTTDHLLICDGERPVGIGGVMGGEESGISEGTVNVLLEAAWFEPKSIRKTARYFGMHTDASHRFERGMDIGFTATATDRAAELIQQVAGGEILKGVLDAYPNPQPRTAVELRRKELDRIIGVQVLAAEVLRILRRLGFRADELGYGNWKLVPPSWRTDVVREIDIVEEVARHYGFERLPDSLCSWAGGIHRPPNAAMERVLRDTARALGYDETIAISLVPVAKTKLFSKDDPPAIGNPLSAESAVLRTSPLPGVLDAVLWNLNHGEAESRVFEVGKIYRHAGEAYEEPPTLGLAAAPGDFLHLKGDIETLLDLFECSVTFDAVTGVDYFHPARSARVTLAGETLGRFGELHPRIATEYGFRQPVWAAEFFLDPLYRAGLRVARHQELPRFPAVDRDFSLLLPDGVTFQSVRDAVTGLGIEDLREVTAGEVFRGGQVSAGQYSLLLRVRFQSTDRTLSDTEVNAHAAAIVVALETGFQATLRS
jgi:phenylalanyl-tRNA synthetase beta chain